MEMKCGGWGVEVPAFYLFGPLTGNDIRAIGAAFWS